MTITCAKCGVELAKMFAILDADGERTDRYIDFRCNKAVRVTFKSKPATAGKGGKA